MDTAEYRKHPSRARVTAAIEAITAASKSLRYIGATAVSLRKSVIAAYKELLDDEYEQLFDASSAHPAQEQVIRGLTALLMTETAVSDAKRLYQKRYEDMVNLIPRMKQCTAGFAWVRLPIEDKVSMWDAIYAMEELAEDGKFAMLDQRRDAFAQTVRSCQESLTPWADYRSEPKPYLRQMYTLLVAYNLADTLPAWSKKKVRPAPVKEPEDDRWEEVVLPPVDEDQWEEIVWDNPALPPADESGWEEVSYWQLWLQTQAGEWPFDTSCPGCDDWQ